MFSTPDLMQSLLFKTQLYFLCESLFYLSWCFHRTQCISQYLLWMKIICLHLSISLPTVDPELFVLYILDS